MSTSEITGGISAAVAALIGLCLQIVDASAFATIFIAVAISIVCGWLTYKVAIRQVKAEIRSAVGVAVADHIKQMHAADEGVPHVSGIGEKG